MPPPILCFGQQPCGFFPKRFLVSKILTARRLQKELGGEIVFFYHDADHDPRETKTTLRHRQSHQLLDYNFEIADKIQRKFSPLFLKQIKADWHKKMINALPNYVAKELAALFAATPPTDVAAFCIEMYRRMGLLEGIRTVRSGDPAMRTAACDITDYFADVPYQDQIVRARRMPDDTLQLHEGGNSFVTVPAPPAPIAKAQITPTRDTRLRWMQSVIHCTHYIAGAGEQQYLNKSEAPEITFIDRDPIERLDEAWTEFP